MMRIMALTLAVALALAFAAPGLAEGGTPAPPPLPGGSDDVTVTPSVVVLGRDRQLAVNGRGFGDCTGSFDLSLRIDDTWHGNEPGVLMGSASTTIGPDGALKAVIPIGDAFPGNWTGFVIMEGGCLGEARRLFGPVALAVPATGQAAASAGISAPAGAEGAAGFLVPASFIESAFVPPDKPGATAAGEFHHLSAWVAGVLCATTPATERERSGDLVVYVGLPDQPATCSTPGATVHLSAGADDTPLLNGLRALPGVVQSLRPLYSPPGTGAGPADATGNPASSPAVNPAQTGSGGDSSLPWAPIALVAGVAVVAGGGAAFAVRRRRKQGQRP